MAKIKNIDCHKILNSRGEWTIETEVALEDGSVGVQAVPSGASKGENEAVYIDPEKAVEVVSDAISDALIGEDAADQEGLDKILIEMDGTPSKQHLGGNSILSVSLAAAKAVSASRKLELFEYLGELYSGQVKSKKDLQFPTPVFNVINGGKHAANRLSVQEFMVIPASNMPFDKAMELGVSIYDQLEENLEKEGFGTEVGDEGGFAPSGFNVKKALDFIKKSASQVCKSGEDIFYGMDAAAESFYMPQKEEYFIVEEGLHLDTSGLSEYYEKLLKKFEIIYLEDPFYEKDEIGWSSFYKKHNKDLMIVADDLAVTNTKYLKNSIHKNLANAVIVKPNQVGTLTETLEFIKMAKENNMKIVLSHRSGDIGEDTFIADLALAVDSEFIKSGAPARGERVVKYNRLLDIFYSIE